MDDVPHMTPDEFRRCGHAVVERIARYMEEVEGYPVLSRAEPGSIRERLPPAAPEHGEPFSDVLRDIDEIVMPGITHWQSPNFFAYFPANASGPSILGDLLSSGLGVQGMLWATSPACTELETHVLDWLVDLLGLPDRFRSTTAGGGVIQDTASSSTLTALLAARERASAGSVNEHGVGFGPNCGPDRDPGRDPGRDSDRGSDHGRSGSPHDGPPADPSGGLSGGSNDRPDRGPSREPGHDPKHDPGHDSSHIPNRDSPSRLTVYTSGHAHSSIEKAVKIAGLGRTNLRLVEVDARHAMRVEALEAAIAADRAAGATPAMVSATVGTTSSGAVDPVRAIGKVCRREGIWLHVDAAHAGSASICPEHRGLVDGVELADSYTFNPHKWLLTNFDCNCFWVADRAALIGALSILPEYLRNRATTSGEVIDYRDWHVPLGRRFRALKLWFVIRHYGAAGLRAHVRRSIALADWFAAQVEANDEFELAAPVSVGLVCFRHRAGDAFNQALMDRLNRSGALYLTHTRLDDRLVLRLAVGAPATRREHVEAAWARIVAAAGEQQGHFTLHQEKPRACS